MTSSDHFIEPVDPGELEKKISKQACSVLNELRKGGQLCDAVLSVEDDGHFPVHRAILSACSPVFRALFTNGMADSEKREFLIPGVTSDMMAIIINYAYTREANVTADNVERLLPAADQFHVLGLVKACTNFLASQLDYTNCIGIAKFAKHFFCTHLEKVATKYTMKHFTDVANKSNELLNLTHEELASILQADELNVKNEEIVFDCIIRWITHDLGNRKKHIVPLLQTVRLGLLTAQYFVETVKNHPYVKETESCRPLVIETLKFLYDLDMNDTDAELHPMARPRIPHELMFVVGGWSGSGPTNVIETYDTRADRWIKVDHVDREPRAYHGCATVANKIYIVGGFDGTNYFNSCRCFDPQKKEWCEVAPMNKRRCYVSVTVLNNCIYAMGGYNGHSERQNSAERYTPKNNQWSLIAPMNHKRSDASSTICDGKVYICGGFNGQECLNTAEYYDPQTDVWTLTVPMRNRRSGVGIMAHNHLVYALGGFNGVTRLNNGEIYNPAKNTWSNMTEMYSPRSNFAVEVLDDMVFVIGGFNGITTICSVECYDPTSEEWYDCTDMNINRSALNACVIRGLPNVRDYIQQNRSNCENKKKRNIATLAVATAANPRVAAANAVAQANARDAQLQNNGVVNEAMAQQQVMAAAAAAAAEQWAADAVAQANDQVFLNDINPEEWPDDQAMAPAAAPPPEENEQNPQPEQMDPQ